MGTIGAPVYEDVLVYEGQNNTLQTIHRKQTDRQNCVDAQPKHTKSLKNRIPYSQALRIKRICSSQ